MNRRWPKFLEKSLEEETHSVMLAHDGVEGFEISQTFSRFLVVQVANPDPALCWMLKGRVQTSTETTCVPVSELLA
jgi:hypothetical protein